MDDDESERKIEEENGREGDKVSGRRRLNTELAVQNWFGSCYRDDDAATIIITNTTTESDTEAMVIE